MFSCEIDATNVGTLMLADVDFVLINGCYHRGRVANKRAD